MLVQTHRLIGEMIYKAIQCKMGYKLNKEAFKYGCIKPDIVPKYRAIAHYKSESFEFVSQMIDEIMDEFVPVSRKARRKYSVKLGMIIHYIGDYFCSAHNYLKYEKIVDHVIYEQRLAKKISQLNFDDTVSELWHKIQNYEYTKEPELGLGIGLEPELRIEPEAKLGLEKLGLGLEPKLGLGLKHEHKLDLAKFLEVRHKEYLNKSSSIKNDISFSLEVSMIVAISIINQSLLGINKKAA